MGLIKCENDNFSIVIIIILMLKPLYVQVAKHELHATTALRQPNRAAPTRIGLVFYQHRDLHHPEHGSAVYHRMLTDRQHASYVGWLAGQWVPAACQKKTLERAGFAFPSQVLLRASKTRRSQPNQLFAAAAFPSFVAGKWERGTGDRFFFEIDPTTDRDPAAFRLRVKDFFETKQQQPNTRKNELLVMKGY